MKIDLYDMNNSIYIRGCIKIEQCAIYSFDTTSFILNLSCFNYFSFTSIRLTLLPPPPGKQPAIAHAGV